MQRPKELLEQVRDAIRLKDDTYSIEQTYVCLPKRFVLQPTKRPPLDIGDKEPGPATISRLFAIASRID